MRVAYTQLKKYLPGLDLSPSELAELLTHQGLVVEGMTPADELFSAECLAATLVETLDEGAYTRCTLQAGSRVYRIAVEGWGVPPVGSRVLVNPTGSGMNVFPLKDLAPVDRTAFLVTLPLENPEGERIPAGGSDDEMVIECEVTANRGDCLSLLGLAREISAGADLDMILPGIHFDQAGKRTDYTLENQDSLDLCPFYTGRLIRNVTVQPSPWSIVRDLLLLGLRPVNNVVDYTNLAMMEFGQPLHAFNASTLREKAIVVRRARRGERIVTLDGEERELTAGMLVIADRQRPVAVAGVMGSQETEVTSVTREVFLEAAVFDGVSVRRTSRSLGMRTEASARFERGVDPQSVIPASARVLCLLAEEDQQPEILSPWLIAGEPPARNREITFRPEFVGEIMAFSVDRDRTRQVLSRLGFQVEDSGNGDVQVAVPPWRTDVQEPIDLVEEVGRIVGYRNIDAVLPEVAFDPGNRNMNWVVKQKLRSFLVDRGLYEVVTISLVNRETVKRAGFQDDELVRVDNPLVHDQDVLRPSLLLSALESLRTNIARGRHPVGIFEIGDVFLRNSGSKQRYNEESRLFLALSGSLVPSLWKHEQEELYFELKGLAESLLERLGVNKGSVLVEPGEDPAGIFEPMRSFAWYRKGTQDPIGWGGLLRQNLVSGSGFWGTVYCLEIRLAHVSELVSGQAVSLVDISRFPLVRRDVSFLCPVDISWQMIEELVSRVAESESMTLESIDLFDCYQGKSLPAHRKSLSFTMVFRSPVQTLTDAQVDCWVSQVKDSLKGLDGVTLREDYSGM